MSQTKTSISLVSNPLAAIGNTPLLPIQRIWRNPRVKILAKMECFNPGGSIKDRIALYMIEQAERRGELSKDKIILEASSGNTGIGLAMVSAVKGYRCLIAMSESASLERRKIMKAYGAEIMLTPAPLATDGAIEAVYSLARKEPDRYFCTDQFNNPDNWLAHYHTTAVEIWNQTGGQVNAIVASMGTTGTLMGITKRMREYNPDIRVIGVEPYLGHRIQGLKNMKESYRPGIFDKHLPDSIVNVHDEDAFEMTRRLAREEGILAGMSSGAAMVAAIEEASRMEEGILVVIFPDSGERYLSTGLFDVGLSNGTEQGVQLKFTNTLTRRKEVFEPLNPGRVGMYSCGPTAYELAHLGLCRRLVVADLIRRVLEWEGYKVTHVMNITDIDDKTICAAVNKGVELSALTEHYIKAFLEDVDTLRVKPATKYPKATEHIDDMIQLCTRLIDAGYAYVKHGSVYFDISKLPSYGRLSRVDLSRIQIGRTVDLDDYEKDSPVDFTLFKRVTLAELKQGIGYKTEWGQVRPGWHIECVAMSHKYLGDFFDIHTSGRDLIFPHHENEIAMSMALTGRPLARMWLHSELIFVNGKKMSRSTGNVVTLRDLLDMGFTGRQVRYFLIRTHYRKPLNYSKEAVLEAGKALARLDEFCNLLHQVAGLVVEDGNSSDSDAGDKDISPEIKELVDNMRQDFRISVLDDLNISGAIAAIYALIKQINPRLSSGDLTVAESKYILDTLKDLDMVLGVLDIPDTVPQLPSDIMELLSQREQARKVKDFKLADKLRDQLYRRGILISDTPAGQRWKWRSRDEDLS